MAPRWFGNLRHEYWVGDYKDLRQIDVAVLTSTAIVDDQEDCIHPDQRQHWIRIEGFERPYPASDNELERIAAILDGLAPTAGGG
jgi:hypothetical protein